MLTDSQSTNPHDLNVEPNISASTQQAGQNNRDCNGVTPTVKTSNTLISHQNRDKDSALTSPQKHREKRKHCDSADSNRHRHKKRKHSKDARFEGQRISHLVKKRAYKKADSGDEAEDQGKSDDYVLAKLFKKSGRFLCTMIQFHNPDKIIHFLVDFFSHNCLSLNIFWFCLFFRYPQRDAA